MRREYIDFHEVPERQLYVHDALLNWARSMNGSSTKAAAPMWKGYQSPPSVRGEASVRVPPDQADARKVNRMVLDLPTKHLKALQWHYVMCSAVIKGQRYVGCTAPELAAYVIDARDMLRNRGLRAPDDCVILAPNQRAIA